MLDERFSFVDNVDQVVMVEGFFVASVASVADLTLRLASSFSINCWVGSSMDMRDELLFTGDASSFWHSRSAKLFDLIKRPLVSKVGDSHRVEHCRFDDRLRKFV